MPPAYYDSGVTYDSGVRYWDGAENNNIMATQNLISATLAAQAVTNINAAIATIRANAPFLISLTKQERSSLPRMGAGSIDFVEKTIAFVQQHPEALPATFNTAEYLKDGALNTPLKPLVALMAQLNEDFDDTGLALGSDLLVQSLDVYAFAKATNRNGAYDAYIDSVKGRFARSPRTPATPPPPTP